MGLDRIGKYRIVGKIGEGGMGEVYRAHDPLLNRSVAVKTIASGVGRDADFQARFRREAQAAAQINHPNIVTVYDFGKEGELTYMAMELLEGRDLKELVAAGRPVSLRDKLAIMEQVCDGVGFAHSKGVVHRDLKPGNIHVQPSGQVKVLDFGLARLGASDMTRTGTVMGTPHYMSPEQVRGAHVDARSDVFSLGAVLYEVLSGRRPFGDGPTHETLPRILSEEPEPIERVAPGTPVPLVLLVRRAMDKDPAKRFPNGTAMAEALRRARAAALPAPLGEPADASGSTWDRGEATVLMPGASETIVEGSVALAAAPSLSETEYVATRRPAATVHAPPTYRPGAGDVTERPARRLGLAIGFGVVVVAGAASALWLASRRPAAAPAETAAAQVDILTEALVTGQVELAREDLENRAFGAAVERAQKALALSPQSAEAREVLALARGRLAERDAAVAEARAALGRGDAEAATRGLRRVLAVDPGHPVVAELSGALDARVRALAEVARNELAPARRGASAASGSKAHADGRRLEGEADALFARGEFTVAAQRYAESKIAFDRARRESEASLRVAAATPSPAAPTAPPTALPTALPTVRPTLPPPTAAPLPAAPAPAFPATSGPVPTAPAAAATAPSVPAGPSAPEAAIRQVIAAYGRAIESRDIDLFRSLKPDLSSDEEKRLREAFKTIKSHQVGLAVDSVQVEGVRASVRVSRQDVVNGRAMKPQQQVFRLVRQGDAWRIQSIGQ